MERDPPVGAVEVGWVAPVRELAQGEDAFAQIAVLQFLIKEGLPVTR